MALQDDCVLWNKLGSNAEVTNSEIGNNGAWIGASTYAGGKFGNGSYSNNSSNYIIFANPFSQYTKGIVEIWLKTDFAVVNGVPQDNAYHVVFGNYIAPAGYTLFFYKAGSSLPGFNFYIWWNGGWLVVNDVTSNWSAGELVHIFCVYDKNTGFDGIKTAAIYVNGVQSASTTTAIGVIGSFGNFRVLYDQGDHLDGLGDNLKIYESVTIIAAIIANKDNEGWPVSGNHRFFQMF